jgi:hypothetical protein
MDNLPSIHERTEVSNRRKLVIKVQPIYKCRFCSMPLEGVVMEITDRPLNVLAEDIIGLAPPVTEPHNCDFIHKYYGVYEYVGFNIISWE